jgi:GNAT superfamily N-acetyltransferase
LNYKNYIGLKRELKRLYPQSIIVLKFYKTPEKHIYLHKISLPEQYKNKGIGTQIMNILCQFSDNNKIDIMLEPTDSFGSDLSRLIKFYESFGFVKYGSEMLRKYIN